MILVHVPFLWVEGMALFPFVLIKYKRHATNARLLNHERIHLRQQLELLLVPFYVWYLAEYAWHRLCGLRHRQAYLRISFEREAYAHEHEPDYLRYRRWGGFRRYL